MLLAKIKATYKALALVYATWNPSDKYSGVILSGGDLIATNDGVSQNEPVRATVGKSAGLWYWEITGANNVGISTTALTMVAGNYPGAASGSYGYNKTGIRISNGSSAAYGTTFSPSDVIGIALDLSAGTLTFYKNGVSQGVAYSGLSGTFYPTCSVFGTSEPVCTANFGGSALTYSPPPGHNPGIYV